MDLFNVTRLFITVLLLVICLQSGKTTSVVLIDKCWGSDSLIVCRGTLACLKKLSISCTKCWVCINANNFVECTASGMLRECQENQVCSTEIRRNNNDIKIWKGCKQREACETQRLQNWERTPHTCNNDQPHSHCWCCCDNDSCNINETCEVTATQCPMPSLKMTHGHVTCSNSNHLGSMCSYTCNETGYHGLPLNKQNRLCLGNGRWSEKKPCCARDCPPYLEMDSVAVLQFNSKENFDRRHAGIGYMFDNLVHSKEYYQEYIVYYNNKVYDVVTPEQTVRMGKHQASANNTANTGAALRYVHDNILAHFHRANRHRDVIYVAGEKESDDDVTKVAAELKKDGVEIYYIFYQSAEYKVNMEEAKQVASSEDHIFVVGGGEKKVDFKKLFDDILTKACNQQCHNDGDE